MGKNINIKLLLFILPVLFLFLINFALGQGTPENPTYIQPRGISEPIKPREISEIEKKCTNSNGKRVSNQFCECPEGSKRVDDKGCLSCTEPDVCCGIPLNTKVPFIGDCIEFAKKCIDGECPTGYKCDEKNKCRVEKTDPNQTVVDEEEAFPALMGGLMRILVTIIMLGSFAAILAGGVMISAAGSDEQRATKGKKLIIDVVIALAILGASGVILRLINPNFFQ